MLRCVLRNTYSTFFHSKAMTWKAHIFYASEVSAKGHESYASYQMHTWEELSRSSAKALAIITDTPLKHYKWEPGLLLWDTWLHVAVSLCTKCSRKEIQMHSMWKYHSGCMLAFWDRPSGGFPNCRSHCNSNISLLPDIWLVSHDGISTLVLCWNFNKWLKIGC